MQPRAETGGFNEAGALTPRKVPGGLFLVDHREAALQ